MSAAASYDFIRVSGVGTSAAALVLDRPKKLNALDLAMVREVADALEKNRPPRGARVARGALAPVGELGELQREHESERERSESGGNVL